jgi:MFS family permease
MASAGRPLGAAVAGPVVGLLAAAAGWRISFIVVAAIGLVREPAPEAAGEVAAVL